MPSDIPSVLSIAGSDPSGGAGIQADLKTFAMLGTYGMAAITSLTVQNTRGVQGFQALEGAFVADQVRSVLDDIPPQAIKTGMIGSAEIARHIGPLLEHPMLICDPVMFATSGDALFEPDAMQTICDQIIARARILTPNLAELRWLSSSQPDEPPVDAARRLFDQYPRLQAVLVKGGHRNPDQGMLTDSLLERQPNQIVQHDFPHPWLDTRNTHGTGCTLASAIAAQLARGQQRPAAVESAIRFLAGLLEQSATHQLGSGQGPLLHHRWQG